LRRRMIEDMTVRKLSRRPARLLPHHQELAGIERRFVCRTPLDLGDAKTAYRVASGAAVPSRESYRAEHQFTSGWIALRFLDDAGTALAHFAKVGQGTTNPIHSRPRLIYWQGRAAEVLCDDIAVARPGARALRHEPSAAAPP
jgi:soluble lytic murein transglycosylase